MQNTCHIAKVALVTGSARRIGAEIARLLHAAGMNIILHYHTSEQAAFALYRALNQERESSAALLKADLCAIKQLPLLIENAVKVWGRLDVLINNASRFYRTPIGHVTENEWDELMTANAKAPFFLAQAAANYLKSNQGCIVNIIDIHSVKPLRDYSIYCVSKSALHMLTKTLAKELAPNVRVNAVAPGAVSWPEGENELSTMQQQKIMAETALQKHGCAQDIAKAVLFFVRDADYVTGQILNVDGGRLL